MKKFLFIALLLISACHANVTNNQSFNFKKYTQTGNFRELERLFPKGTPRADVEQKLIAEGGARSVAITISPSPYKNILYRHDSKDPFMTYGISVNAFYDDKDNVHHVDVSGGKITGEQINPKIAPEKFDTQAWLDYDTPHGTHTGELELNQILTEAFPIGTTKAEVEQYILTSKDLYSQNDLQPRDFKNTSKNIVYRYVKVAGDFLPCRYIISADYINYELAKPLKATRICKALIEL